MNELGKLRQALRHYELAEQSFEQAREDFRSAVRAYLTSKTEEYGETKGNYIHDYLERY